MTWKQIDKMLKKLGIPRASKEEVRRAGVFGTTFVGGPRIGLRVVLEDRDPEDDPSARRDRSIAWPERGEDPKQCPFSPNLDPYGVGQMLEVPPSVMHDLLERRFGCNDYRDGLVHLMCDRDEYDEDELNEGRFGLVTESPLSQGVPYRRIDRRGAVSIRRRWNGSIVISRRGYASDPIVPLRGVTGAMLVHRAGREGAIEFEDACSCLATAPFTRWLVEDEAAERLEEALRRTDELIEFGVPTRHGVLHRSTWLIGRARGRGAALWPTAENALCTLPSRGAQSIDMRDAGIADEVRQELVEINRDYGTAVPGRFHGDLDPASAWELLCAPRERR